MKRVEGVFLVMLLLACACEKKESSPPSMKETPSVPTSEQLASMQRLMRGSSLFQEHCAQCHGPEAQGHPDWQNPQVVAAPPLNGGGNVWKRNKRDLIAVIKNGASRKGEPVMPSWKGRLSDQDIEDVIAWLQALWPPDVYDRWRKANAPPTSPRAEAAR